MRAPSAAPALPARVDASIDEVSFSNPAQPQRGDPPIPVARPQFGTDARRYALNTLAGIPVCAADRPLAYTREWQRDERPTRLLIPVRSEAVETPP